MRIISLLLISACLAGCEPKTFEDCVIDAMQDAGSASAAAIARAACRSKFPDKEAYLGMASIQTWAWSDTQGIVNSVTLDGINGRLAEITNRGEKTITTVTIGESVSGECSNKKDDYTQFIRCGKAGTVVGVDEEIPENTTDTIVCSNEINNACVVGVVYKDQVYVSPQ